MNSANQKLNQHLAQTIAKHVDQLGSFIQDIIVESYIQGYNDRAKDDADNIPKPYVLGYESKVAAIELIRGKDGLYHPCESGDLAGMSKEYLFPSEWDISMCVDSNNIVRELRQVCKYQNEEYTIHSFSEKPDGTILVGIGPSMTEYLTESGKRMKVVNIDELD